MTDHTNPGASNELPPIARKLDDAIEKQMERVQFVGAHSGDLDEYLKAGVAATFALATETAAAIAEIEQRLKRVGL